MPVPEHQEAQVSRSTERLRVAPEVAAALADGAPVVALESTIISHGLPRPDNLRIAQEIEGIVHKAGAVRRPSRWSAGWPASAWRRPS